MTTESFEHHLHDWLMRKTGSGAVRRVADLSAAVASNVGLVRTDNQDRAAVLRFSEQAGQQSFLFVVCDGMGGMADGAKCAAKALASFSAAFMRSSSHSNAKARLMQAASTANNAVYKLYRGSGGATLSAVLFQSNAPSYWVNIGDSRIYHFGGRLLHQITVDDTLAGQLAREPSSYDGRSELLQFAGSGPMAEPHVGDLAETAGDSVFLITTDGVHYLPINVMQELIIHAPDSVIVARRLMDLATWFGGHDNATLAIACPAKMFADDVSDIKSNTVEVWDAFGEIRFLNTTFENKTPPIQSVHELTEELPLPPPAGLSASEVKGAIEEKKQLAKTKRPTKKRGTAKNSLSKTNLVEPPQLMINFRKKEGAE